MPVKSNVSDKEQRYVKNRAYFLWHVAAPGLLRRPSGLAAGTQTGVDAEPEGAIREQCDGLRKLPDCGEPPGGLLEDQPRGVHERPPAEFDGAFLFLRIDSPSLSMR